MQKPKRISRTELKFFASFCMFCDHFALMFFSESSFIYWLFRYPIGRMAFPVFLFLFAEGWFYIRKERHKRHLFALSLSAFASLPGYSFVATGKWISFKQLNIMITWLLCYLLLLFLENIKKCKWQDVRLALSVSAVGIAIYITVLIRADYLFIALFYTGVICLTKDHTSEFQRMIFCIVFSAIFISPWAGAALVPLLIYSPKKKSAKKYSIFFYIFYPAHLFALSLIRCLVF